MMEKNGTEYYLSRFSVMGVLEASSGWSPDVLPNSLKGR